MTNTAPTIMFFDDNAPPPKRHGRMVHDLPNEVVAGAIKRLLEKGFCAVPAPTEKEARQRGNSLARQVMGSSGWTPLMGEPRPRFISVKLRVHEGGEFPYRAYLTVTERFLELVDGHYPVQVDRNGDRVTKSRQKKKVAA